MSEENTFKTENIRQNKNRININRISKSNSIKQYEHERNVSASGSFLLFKRMYILLFNKTL